MSEIENRFNRLASEWRRNKQGQSRIEPHPEIIGMGMTAVPFILRSLQRHPDHWFSTLVVITGAQPVPEANLGSIDKMAQAWIDWGKTNKLI